MSSTSSNDIGADYLHAPIDEQSRQKLAALGLELRLVDTANPVEFDPWVQADIRGFLGDTATPENLLAYQKGTSYRRHTGVYDPQSADPMAPVGTANSWTGKLSVPGDRELEAWAISSVTVAPTHRRRGVQRQIMEAELRTARDLGLAMAMLTVSESSIYGRYGFGPATLAQDFTIDTRRVRWTGPATEGRIDFVTPEQWVAGVAELHERIRVRQPGEVPLWDLRIRQFAGLEGEEGDVSKKRRFVRFADAAGTPRAWASYRVTGGASSFTDHTVTVGYLIAETPDAASALWRFFVEMDLVSELKADLRSVGDPLPWQLGDFRAAKIETYDMQYLRILDVPAALAARTYAAHGSLVLEVSDPLDFATGLWLLEVDAPGSGTVSRVDSAPAGVPAVTLSVVELSAVYLGGVSARVLRDAGRVTGDADALDALFASATVPYLSIWY